MSETTFTLTVLGSRGSMAVCGQEQTLFGGDTSCYLVRAGEEALFLDGGSGLIGAPTDFPHTPVILLTHLHLDHLLGLGMYPRLSRRGQKTRLFLPAADRESALRALDGVYTPPYWPLHLSNYAGDVQIEPLRLPLQVGPVTVEGMRGNHPGECVVFRLRYAGKTLVYCTDYERTEASFSSLVSFAEGADLVLYDGQYTPEQMKTHAGFGHSTAEDGMELMARSGAKRLLIVHHDPGSTDEELLRRESQLGCSNARYARVGEVIEL